MALTHEELQRELDKTHEALTRAVHELGAHLSTQATDQDKLEQVRRVRNDAIAYFNRVEGALMASERSDTAGDPVWHHYCGATALDVLDIMPELFERLDGHLLALGAPPPMRSPAAYAGLQAIATRRHPDLVEQLKLVERFQRASLPILGFAAAPPVASPTPVPVNVGSPHDNESALETFEGILVQYLYPLIRHPRWGSVVMLGLALSALSILICGLFPDDRKSDFIGFMIAHLVP